MAGRWLSRGEIIRGKLASVILSHRLSVLLFEAIAQNNHSCSVIDYAIGTGVPKSVFEKSESSSSQREFGQMSDTNFP
jgi:hypothetical protein